MGIGLRFCGSVTFFLSFSARLCCYERRLPQDVGFDVAMLVSRGSPLGLMVWRSVSVLEVHGIKVARRPAFCQPQSPGGWIAPL